jgi:hypothetical protein
MSTHRLRAWIGVCNYRDRNSDIMAWLQNRVKGISTGISQELAQEIFEAINTLTNFRYVYGFPIGLTMLGSRSFPSPMQKRKDGGREYQRGNR